MTLYQEVVAKNIPHSNHYSDLYVPITEETTNLLKKHGLYGTVSVTTFKNQVEGGNWYDIAFQYAPFWNKI